MRWDEFRELLAGLATLALCFLSILLWMVACAPPPS